MWMCKGLDHFPVLLRIPLWVRLEVRRVFGGWVRLVAVVFSARNCDSNQHVTAGPVMKVAVSLHEDHLL